MHVDRFCSMDLEYTRDFHMARPYGNESGLGWGAGDGTVTGECAAELPWLRPLARA
jgi:hypothetical protein